MSVLSRLLDPTQPLWLPRGSVRALIALIIVVGYIWTKKEVDKDLVLLVLGFYFGSKLAGAK